MVYAPALALSAVTDLSYLGSVLAVGIVCTFYSTLGGIKAVLITDVFQSLLMFAAIGCVVIGGTLVIGSPMEVLLRAQDRLHFFDFNPDPTIRHTFWTQLVRFATNVASPTFKSTPIQIPILTTFNLNAIGEKLQRPQIGFLNSVGTFCYQLGWAPFKKI